MIGQEDAQQVYVLITQAQVQFTMTEGGNRLTMLSYDCYTSDPFKQINLKKIL